MNPFERLRKAIDKVEINYRIPEEQEKEPEFLQTVPANLERGEDLQAVWMEKQTGYIQEINRLASKVEKLEKGLKKTEIQNEELVKEVCQMEKNNELLVEKINQLSHGEGHWEDKERKYKEEIHRINSTVNQLGAELNQERMVKKNLSLELSKVKETLGTREKHFESELNNLSSIISQLKEEIAQRSEMLEYNIKKSADERRESKLAYDLQKKTLEQQLEQIRAENGMNREKICTLNGDLKLEKQRQMSLNEKIHELTLQIQRLKEKHSEQSTEIEALASENQKNSEDIKGLLEENEDLRAQLRLQKENIKVKIVEVRDETLSLELEMYKKQCKDLLQEKVIMGSLTQERAFSPRYEIVERQ